MESPAPKINFYRERTFGEKLNTTFDYLRHSWRPLLRYSLYFILPLCLVQAFFLNRVMSSTFIDIPAAGESSFSNVISRVLTHAVGVYCCYIAGYILLSALLYSLMQTYERREGGLVGVTFDELRAPLGRLVGRSVRVLLFGLLLSLLVGAFIGLPALLGSLWTLLATIPVTLLLVLLFISPLWLFAPLYLLGDRPFFASFRQAFRWGMPAWFEIFGLMLVFGLIGSIVNMVTYLPWYLFTFIGQLFSYTEGNGMADTLWFQLTSYILGIIQSYGYYLSQVIAMTGIAFEYFHLREKHEGVSAATDIASFSKL